MRDEGPRTLASWGEVIRIAREAGIPAQVNHHKVTGAAQFGWSTRTIALLDSARGSTCRTMFIPHRSPVI
jgi:N-acyl-D-aspartate/D-glutamate deacylase